MNGTHQLAANPKVVAAFAQHLLNAYEQYINEADGEVGYLDGFMAMHNAHCAIVFGLERDGDMDAAAARVLRDMAIGTFTERMKREPLP